MNLSHERIVELMQDIKGLKIQTNVSLKKFSNWKVGGVAKIVVAPKNLEEIIELKTCLNKYKLKNLVIGNTTNLLFTDQNIQAVLVNINQSYSGVNIEGNTIKAQSGIWVPRLARVAQQAGLSGIEHICGIPGTLGGLVVMNGGSQRKGIGEHVSYVKTVDKFGVLKEYTQKDCQFSYRTSIFQELEETIVEVGLQLKPTVNKSLMHKEMLSILKSRSKKFPRKQPNCGSVFISNPAMYEQYGPPGKVIEECGLKGLCKGGAQVSYEHANFIVNNNNASANDILFLIQYIRDIVYKKTGYLMQVEAKFVNESCKVVSI